MTKMTNKELTDIITDWVTDGAAKFDELPPTEAQDVLNLVSRLGSSAPERLEIAGTFPSGEPYTYDDSGFKRLVSEAVPREAAPPPSPPPQCAVEGCTQTKAQHDYLHSTHEYKAPKPQINNSPYGMNDRTDWPNTHAPIPQVEELALTICKEVYGPYMATVNVEHRTLAIEGIARVLRQHGYGAGKEKD
jgi:hypothetical protein